MNTHHHHRGLLHDLERLRNLQGRRTVLRMMAGATLLPLVRCTAVGADDDDGAGTSGADAGRTDGSAAAGTVDAGPVGCSRIPEETGYPSASNLTRTSLTSDRVFSDGSSLQVPMVTGNVVDSPRNSLWLYAADSTTTEGCESQQKQPCGNRGWR
jgi:hypothetical protein